MSKWNDATAKVWLASADPAGIDGRTAFVEQRVGRRVLRTCGDEFTAYRERLQAAGTTVLLGGAVLRVHVDAAIHLVHARELRNVHSRRGWWSGRLGSSAPPYLRVDDVNRATIALAARALPGWIGSLTQLERTLERVVRSQAGLRPLERVVRNQAGPVQQVVEVGLDDLGRVVAAGERSRRTARIRVAAERLRRGIYVRLFAGGHLHAVIAHDETGDPLRRLRALSLGVDASPDVLQARAALAR